MTKLKVSRNKRKSVGLKKRRYKHDRPEYTTPAYREFVRRVKVRDNDHCQYPGCKRHRFGMEVHHIIPWCKAPRLRYEPSNGVTLCSKCHKKVTGNELSYAAMFCRIVQMNIIKQAMKVRGYQND